jgi:NADPH:quinone reductase-like Zn-dependent oxidoreductase
MKAITRDRYGSPDVLELSDIDKPVIKDDEVLVSVQAASVQAGDWHLIRGLPYLICMMGFGLLRPKTKVTGFDFAGRVEAVGSDAKRFQPGDEVFGASIGAFAEYVCADEDKIVPKPANATFEQAATVPSSALAALHGLRDAGNVQANQKVLINGASGGVGTFAVQIAKSFGAVVTGVDCAAKLDMIRSLGADRVIDYAVEDFTQGSERYDLVFDIPGNHSLSECRRVVDPDGKYVIIGYDRFGDGIGKWAGNLPRFFRLIAMGLFVKQLPSPSTQMTPRKEMMSELKELIESEKLTPLIDRTFPLSEVPQAIRYLEECSALGRIVITVG